MKCFMPDALYGIMGWPLGHSFSPLLHNMGFQILGIPAVYMSWPFEEKDLPEFMEAMRIMRVKGCSVTIPHKISVLRYVDSVSEGASLAGAVNTLFWRDNELCGENTDISGFLAPLENVAIDTLDALILGAGGAAHAVGAALRLRGCRHARVASPGDRRQFEMAERFGFEGMNWRDRYRSPADLVINATPAGMKGRFENECPYDFALAPKVARGMAYDLVYNPADTIFLRQAAKAGRQTISGLEMFYWQANAQFRLWTGENLPLECRNVLYAALGASLACASVQDKEV